MFENLFEWIQGVRPEQLPAAPLVLERGVVIINVAGWLEAVKKDALEGENGPRARTGGLQKDLRKVRELCS